MNLLKNFLITRKKPNADDVVRIRLKKCWYECIAEHCPVQYAVEYKIDGKTGWKTIKTKAIVEYDDYIWDSHNSYVTVMCYDPESELQKMKDKFKTYGDIADYERKSKEILEEYCAEHSKKFNKVYE